MDPVEVLLRYPLFSLLGRTALARLVECGRQVTIATGQVVLEKGVPGKYIIVLLSGRVRMSRKTLSGEEKSLGVLPAGSVFGEYSLVPPHLNTATCRASAACKALLIPVRSAQYMLEQMIGFSGDLKNWIRLQALLHHFRFGLGFGFMTAPSVMLMLDRGEELQFAASHTIQASGLLADRWLYITDGDVSIQEEPDSPSCVLRAGDCFGEGAMLSRSHLPLVTALTDVKCWTLSRDSFLGLSESADHGHVQTLQTMIQPNQRTRKWQAQRSAADCGIAAMTMAVQSHGVDTTFEELHSMTSVGPSGVGMSDLVGVLRRVGVEAVAVRLSPQQLRHAQLPAILHFEQGHYVTLFEIRESIAVIGDPAVGMRETNLSDLSQIASGNIILISRRTPNPV